jgi:hypothetical protein
MLFELGGCCVDAILGAELAACRVHVRLAVVCVAQMGCILSALCCCRCCKKKDAPPEPIFKEDKDRKCTDVLCLLLFLLFWGGMVAIAIVGFKLVCGCTRVLAAFHSCHIATRPSRRLHPPADLAMRDTCFA